MTGNQSVHMCNAVQFLIQDSQYQLLHVTVK